jgi:hypothetical protein
MVQAVEILAQAELQAVWLGLARLPAWRQAVAASKARWHSCCRPRGRQQLATMSPVKNDRMRYYLARYKYIIIDGIL